MSPILGRSFNLHRMRHEACRIGKLSRDKWILVVRDEAQAKLPSLCNPPIYPIRRFQDCRDDAHLEKIASRSTPYQTFQILKKDESLLARNT